MRTTAELLSEQGIYFGNLDTLAIACTGMDSDKRHLVESALIGQLAALTPNGRWLELVAGAVKLVDGDAR